MDTDALEEELLAVQAIFPECISRDSRSPRRLTIRPLVDTGADALSVTLSFSDDYPEQLPSILAQSGIEHSQIQRILEDSWSPGEVCLFMLVDSLRDKFNATDTSRNHGTSLPTSPERSSLPNILSSDSDEDNEVRFFTSSPIVDRKSTFLGRAIEVHSRAEAKAALMWLKQHNKKTAKATHNIVAWRIVEDGILMQGCAFEYYIDPIDNDDDGEDAAGGRLAHLLDIMVLSPLQFTE